MSKRPDDSNILYYIINCKDCGYGIPISPLSFRDSVDGHEPVGAVARCPVCGTQNGVKNPKQNDDR
jgi:C4-type Zn-finger protein